MLNGEISTSFKADTSRFVVDFHKHKVRLSNIGTTISVGGTWFDLTLSERPESCGKRVEDKLGQSIETVLLGEAVDLPVRVILHLRRYMERPLIGLFGRIENDGTQAEQIGDFVLAKNALVDISGENDEISVHVARGIAHPLVVPLVDYKNDGSSQSEARNSGKAKKFHADSNGMATLSNKNSGHTFTMGFATGRKNHRPVVSVSYNPDTDEVLVDGTARFNGVTLSPQESVETDLLILQATDNPFSSLESYASLIAEMEPVRERKATTGWCSWYAIRLPISHEFTMANARVVAERFRDLGMDIMLLDHGWQTGDICGDWDEDKKDYPEGLDGLAEDLDSLGLKLGIWIAPTEVAETSQFFQEHPDRVLRDKDGNPQPTGRWFWEPNPAQYQIDATHPDAAYKYIVDTFHRLTDLGSVYYKIDFIAGCSGEHLYPVNPKAARGWTPLREAMLAVREGAGENAYVRYCQTPPLLSTGLADGVYATSDTLDAGASTWDVLRDVFRMSSAEYFLHGLYNHDGCDLSVRVHAGTEECRLRVMMLALSGSSIMFSDDLTKLPEERIVLMQQSMPPFPKAARPINLFTSAIPDVWHLRCKHCDIEWDLLALFNFEETQKAVTISWEDLGLPEDEKYIVREFWTEESLGTVSGSATLIVPGLAGRLYSLWNSKDRPQYVGTNLHMSQGEAELVSISWDKDARKLSGILRRAPGISGKAYYSIPPGWEIHRSSHPMLHQNGGLWAMELSFSDAELAWEISFG